MNAICKTPANRFDLWPFAFTTATPEEAEHEARKLACDMLAAPHGRCLSAMLADAYQCPATPSNTAARAAFVSTLEAFALAGLNKEGGVHERPD